MNAYLDQYGLYISIGRTERKTYLNVSPPYDRFCDLRDNTFIIIPDPVNVVLTGCFL